MLKKADAFIEQEIYVLVVNPSDKLISNYTLGYSSLYAEKVIYDGQLIHAVINPKDNDTFIYNKFDKDAPAIITLFIT